MLTALAITAALCLPVPASGRAVPDVASAPFSHPALVALAAGRVPALPPVAASDVRTPRLAQPRRVSSLALVLMNWAHAPRCLPWSFGLASDAPIVHPTDLYVYPDRRTQPKDATNRRLPPARVQVDRERGAAAAEAAGQDLRRPSAPRCNLRI